jgi:hypothetical protein
MLVAFAVKFEVTLPEGSAEEGQRMLDEGVVPQAKAQPGFLSGIWMRNAASPSEGVGIVVFGSEQEARDGADALRPPPGGPSVRSVDVYEVGAQA